jgi:hypothetical protein
MLQNFAHNFRARAYRQRSQLVQRFFGAEFRNIRSLRSHRTGGSVAGGLGSRGQRAALYSCPGRRRPAGAGTHVEADQKRTFPGRTIPVRRRAAPGLAVVGLILAERLGSWTAQIINLMNVGASVLARAAPLQTTPRKRGRSRLHLHPSVPEGRGIAAASGLADGVTAGAGNTVGLSPCNALPMATVEMACLKINCS